MEVNKMHTIKVLLADDHDSFRRILFAFLKAQKGIEIVGEAADGKEVVEQAERLRPDVVFMDSNEFYCQKAQEYSDGFIAKSSMKKALLSVLSNEQQLHREAMTAKAFAA
jgi:DNA-binding NarL/FixJ family response regulator